MECQEFWPWASADQNTGLGKEAYPTTPPSFFEQSSGTDFSKFKLGQATKNTPLSLNACQVQREHLAFQ